MRYVVVPAVSRKLHVKLLENLAKAARINSASEYNPVSGQGEWGVICNGVSYNYIQDALQEWGLPTGSRSCASACPTPCRLKRSKLPARMPQGAGGRGGRTLHGRGRQGHRPGGRIDAAHPRQRGRTFFALVRIRSGHGAPVVAAYFGIDHARRPAIDLSRMFPEIPARPPNLCAGCSHRATFYAIKKAAGAPTRSIRPISAAIRWAFCRRCRWAISSSAWDPRSARRAVSPGPPSQKVVALIGDSTFFHSGITGLVNACTNNHNFTLVILDNGTTAMTGHQPHPGVDMLALEHARLQPVSIEALVRALGVEHVTVVKPFKVAKKSIAAIRRPWLTRAFR
jgi:indolepyruvate ferredoxin oxidoreductase, alpha subunit